MLDGDVGEWPLIHRAYPKVWENPSVPNAEIYGVRDNVSGDLYFAITRVDAGTIQQTTTIFLDTDQSSNAATTHGLSESEYYVDFVDDALGLPVPHLYKTSPWAWLGPIEHALSTDQKVVEMVVSATITEGAESINYFVDLNDSLFFPTFFSSPWFVAGFFNLPEPIGDKSSKLVAIVYSRESEEVFFGGDDVNKYIYRKLYASFQHQVMMSGIPFNLIYMDELKELENCIKYSALVFPYAAYVQGSDRNIIADNLRLAVHHYQVSVIAGDNFLTNVAGPDVTPFANPYSAMWEILGITIVGYGAGDFVVEAANAGHPRHGWILGRRGDPSIQSGIL